MLVRCLYASRAAARLERPMVDAILAQARRNNLARGITGILCHCDASFIQVLEGGRDAVGELLGAIMRDERHHGVRILVYEEIGERRFGQWAMGQVEAARVNQALLLKYSATAQLDPFGMPGCSTMSLLEELRATASIVGRGA
jgi:hypothetical protein